MVSTGVTPAFQQSLLTVSYTTVWPGPSSPCTPGLRLYLVLALEHQEVGDLPEGQPQGDDLALSNVAGQFADVNDP